MPRSGTGFLPRPVARRTRTIPVGSVLAKANRKPEAMTTIGRWRVVSIPVAQRQVARQHPGAHPPARDQDLPPRHEEFDLRPAFLLLQGSLPALPEAKPAEPPAEIPVLPAEDARPGVDAAVPESVARVLESGALPWVDTQPESADPLDRLPQLGQHQLLQNDQEPADPEAAPAEAEVAAARGPLHQPPHPAPATAVRRSLPAAAAAHQRTVPRPLAPAAYHAVDAPPRAWHGWSAASWALLSQVFWIPLLALDLHDRWVAHQRDTTPPGQALPPSPIASASSGLNDLLGAVKPVRQLAGQANQVLGSALGQAVRGANSSAGVLLSSAGSSTSSLLDRPFSLSLESASPASPAAAAQDSPGLPSLQSAHGLLGRAFTRAQLLGGSIGLKDLQEGPMAPLALAERALQRSSSDPLAPLPSLWREPMRQALLRLPGAPRQVSAARTVILPSRAVNRTVEVPLALQSDGSVDVLEPPSNPAVLREIEGWSRQQRLPDRGSLQPALLQVHPLSEADPIVPPAVSATASPRPAVAVGSSRGRAPLSAPAPQAVPLPRPQETAAPAAAAAPIPLPIVSERPAPAVSEAPIPVPILREASAPSP